MATKKSDKKFDASLFKGYDCYDLDFSLQTGVEGKNIVTYEILLEHFSAGNFSGKWINETIKFNKKWKKELPVKKADVTSDETREQETGAYRFLLKRFVKTGHSVTSLFHYFTDPKFIKLIGLKRYFALLSDTLKLYVTNSAKSKEVS